MPGPGWGTRAPGMPPGGWAPPPPKPGIVPLRPLGVGEILDGAISAIRSNPRVMLGLSAALAALTQLIQVPLTWALLHDSSAATFSFDTTSATGTGDLSFAADTIVASGVGIVVTLLATLVLTGILTIVVSRAVLGERMELGAAWAAARPRLAALLGVTVVYGVMIALCLGLGVLPGVLLGLLSGSVGLGVGLGLLGGLLGLAAGIYLYVAFALAAPAVVLERQGVRAALKRSRGLVRGAWWRTFGILALVTVIGYIVSSIIAIPFTIGGVGVAYLVGGEANAYALSALLLSAIGTILAAAITWPFTAAGTVLLYVDRRMRREGLDLELARAAGVQPPGSSATPGTAPAGPYPTR